MFVAVRSGSAAATTRTRSAARASIVLATLHAASLSTAAAMADPKSLSAEEWRKTLTPEQFHVSLSALNTTSVGGGRGCAS
jgi:hypothetical protein